MKFLFVVKKVFGFAGGSERSLLELLRYLKESGDICEVITQQQEHGIQDFLNDIGIYTCSPGGIVRLLHERKTLFNPDAVITQLEWAPPVLAELRNDPICKILFIRTEKDIRDVRQFLRCTDIGLVVANSRFIQNRIFSETGIKSIVVYPLIDIPSILTDARRGSHITMVNFRPEKGSRIFTSVARRMPDQEFLAVRGWKHYGSGRARRSGNMLIVGPTRDMRPVYAKTKILLIPSQWQEPYGRVAIEAMANGIPVIASAVGGLPEALGTAGILVDDYQQVDAWIRSIRMALGHRSFIALSRTGRDHARNYSIRHEFDVFRRTAIAQILWRRSHVGSVSGFFRRILFGIRRRMRLSFEP